MIEVLFEKSEAIFMKMAKEKGVISGAKDEVVCLNLMLDIGDIKEKIDSEYRKNIIFDMYTQNGYDNIRKHEEVEKEYVDEVNRFMDYVLKGEKIRIWYNNAPYAICGFYYLCNLLKDNPNEIFAIKLPEYTQMQEMIVSYQGGEGITPENIGNFIMYEKKISQMEIIMFSDYWTELIEDNSYLRAMINGHLVGVPVDFYDYLLYKHIGNEPIKVGKLIGYVIGKYKLGVSDWWYASRIEHMIKCNKLKIVEDSDNKYKRLISYV